MKHVGFSVFFTIIILLFHIPLSSSSIRFDHIAHAEGLSQGTVYCIYQDSRGFMWFGTEDGLNKYDGYTFTPFRSDPRNPFSLGNNFVMAICEDKDTGDLWLGTWGGGLNRFYRGKETFERYSKRREEDDNSGPTSNDIYTLFMSRNGTLYIGTQKDGLNFREPDQDVFHVLKNINGNSSSLSDNRVRVICEDRKGFIWVGTSRGGLNRLKPGTDSFLSFMSDKNRPDSISDNLVAAIYIDQKDGVWIGTGKGLNKYERESGAFRRYSLLEKNSAGGEAGDVWIKSILQDSNGFLWLGTRNHGLFKFDPKTGASRQFVHDPRYRDSLEKNHILCLYRDESGIFWIGTYGGGLNKFEPERPKFTHHAYDPYNTYKGLSDSDVMAICEDDKGLLWLGTDGGGLNRFEPATGIYHYYRHDPKNPESISHNKVYSIARDKAGALWIGTYGGGLNRFEPESNKFRRFTASREHLIKPMTENSDSISNNYIIPVIIDRGGIVWIGTLGGGLNRFDPVKETFIHYRQDTERPDSISSDKIYSICQDRSGDLWVGTAGGGLNRLERRSDRFICYRSSVNSPESLSSNTILSIFQDRDGILWFGTTGGLNRLNNEKGTFKTFGIKEGLPNEVINAIQQDKAGNLWISTNMGLSRFDPQKNTFRNFNVTDGIQGYEFNMGSSFNSQLTGKLYFGGINGFNSFIPGQIKVIHHFPKVAITSFKMHNAEKELENHISETREMVLDYNQSSFAFEFAALDYSDPPQNQYAYQLLGSDGEEWTELGNDRSVAFKSLSHGTYTLRVKAANNNGIWSEKPAELTITINPPFWKEPWFAVIVIFSIAGILVLTIRSRFRKLEEKHEIEKRQEKIELQREMEKKQLENELKLKADFTAMLVHDLRSPLTAIMGYADLLSSTPDEVNIKSIKKIGDTVSRSSDRMLSLINDMLDISKFEAGKMKVTKRRYYLVTLVKDIAGIMQPLFDKKNVQVKYEFPEIPRVFIDPEKIGQVIDNLISNAIKFSPANGVVTLRVREITVNNKPYQEFSVTDVGPGVPKDKRASLFDKYAQFQSTPDVKGTGLGLAVSRLIIDAHGGIIGYKPDEGLSHTFYFQVPVSGSQKSRIIDFNPD